VQVEVLKQLLENAFAFVETCYHKGQEMVLLVSGLGRNQQAVKFFSVHECEPFLYFSKMLLYKNEEKKLLAECETYREIVRSQLSEKEFNKEMRGINA
jgi:hypothetical protein